MESRSVRSAAIAAAAKGINPDEPRRYLCRRLDLLSAKEPGFALREIKEWID
jgi:hypothetical protein